MNEKPSPLPFRKALQWIFLSTLLISGSCVLGVWYFRHVKETYAKDSRYNIVALVQTCNENECLHTAYLAEMLDLSVDKPSNLYRFKIKEAKKRLLESPLIKSAEVRKIKPGTVYIDYSLRKPVAYVAEYSNTAIDEDGVLIPFNPFFTPKNIPEFVLGISDDENGDTNIKWGTRIQKKKTQLALHILKLFTENFASEGTNLQRIDVSKAMVPSYGLREIIIHLEDREEKWKDDKSYLYIYPRTLRLSTQNYQQDLENFVHLRERLNRMGENASSQSTVLKAPLLVIDMRIPQLAFISK